MALKIESQSNFINELCKYYMEFLKDGFKSNRFPKRYIRLNEKNYKTGIDLSKYEKFNTFIKKLVIKDTNFQNPITIKKGEYSVQLNNTAQDLIRKLVKKIDEKDIEKIVNLANKTVKEFSISHRNKADEAYDQIVDIIKKDLTKIIIQPISEKIEPLIGSQSNFELESLWTVEQNISELILDPLVEGIPSIFNDILADKKNKPKEQIAELFNKKDIANSLLNYFENIQVKDLYYDLQEIVNSRKNLDKKEIYLYFSEIEIEKKRFPLFYMQLEIKEFSSESKFEVSFSNELFVNKNAIKYSFDVLKKDQKLVEIFNEERKIYISEQENLCEKLNNIINSIIPKLRLEGNINLSNPTAQISKSINFVISNNSSICVFDKSDEALINDFEDILSKISEGEDSEVVELFKSIITDFLMNEPEVINENLEDSWDGMSVNERLNYTSPIPLNPEQLKILKALKDPKCKYVVVEGPPGTGKSHTISAIAFDYVLNEKSILILSDTREALDVVENKINNTLNKVRGKDPLQNPILRLGKMGNTYNKILAKSSIDNIRTFHRAQKNGINEIDKDIKDISDVINDRVKIETDHYQYIDKEKLEEFSEIQKLVSPSDLFIDPIALKENIKKLDISIANEDLNLNIFIDRLFEIEEIEDLTENFKDLWAGKKDLESFINYLEHLKIINDYINNKNSNLKSLHFFQKPFAKNLLKLKPIIDEFEEMKSSFLGTMLKGDRIVHLSNQAKSIVGIKKNVNLKFDDDKIKIVYQEYEELRLLCKKSSEFELLDFDKICKIILNCEKFETIKDFCKKTLKYEIFLKVLLKDILNTKNVSINPKNIDSIFKNIFAQIGSEKKEAIKKYYEMEEFFSNSFNIKERFDYTSLMEKLQSLNTSKMTNILDERIIKFYDTNRNNATTLSKIIKSKQKFPKNQFSKLKNAFPCIISSVRDFAEYIQLDKDMFDLIIIDEASQVSIAQAFPALIRAKKILVLGDKKQFSNLQSYQAATLVNNARLNDLRKVFKANISKESDALTRLESFNVKTSILDFFQSIANFDTRLKKHFRGYPEHIEYCSKTFYNSDLQAIRMRIKPINEVIKFEYLDFSNEEEGNFNKKETEVIIKHLEKMKEKKIIQSVGIITPFSDQQKYLTTQISKHPDRDYFFEKMKLKIMTFDTCQGEEREVVFYSMVACNKRNKLNTIFPVDLSNKDLEETGDKKAQRLNVGFSRVQETMHIIHSRPLDKIDGEIGNALRFIKNLSAEEKLPSKSELDPNSPMEIKVLEWFKKTNFYLENKKNVELKAQFEIGKYLKQLDSDYSHPKFVTDFLVIFSTEDGPKQVIIEYDGLKDHFDNQELITDENFDEFYTTQHYEREKALETYGYNFIRLNKFNTTDDPVKFLDKKLKEVFSKKEKLNLSQYKILESVTKSKLGEEKFCERCNEQKSLNEFKDRTLRTGVGVVCRTCKGINGPAPKGKIQKNENKFKQSKVKYKLVEGNIYEISYVNASGWASKRQITVKSVDQKFVKAFDSITHENRTFRKDRIKDSKKL